MSMRFVRRAMLSCAAYLLLGAVPAAAEPFPFPEAVALPSERPVVEELRSLILSNASAPPGNEMLPAYDRLLAQLPDQTQLRGFIQLMRAGILFQTERLPQAVSAVDEAVRLLPDYSGPLFLASMIAGYSDRAQQSTDYFLRASRIDPHLARDIPDFELNNLVSRLRQSGDTRRLVALAERLFEIGWQGNDLDLRSTLARRVISSRVADGDLDAARQFLPNLLDPGDAYAMLALRRYESLWPDIERWAGPRQQVQWRTYLRELRDSWEASRDPWRAWAYARALREAGHEATLIREMLPLFDRLDRERSYPLIWVLPILADALSRQRRWEEAEAIYARAMQAWPLGSDANALNVAANLPLLRLRRGDIAGALRGLEAAIADSNGRAGQVSSSALGAMHAQRACALHMLGRDPEALSSIAIGIGGGNFDTRIRLLLCLDRQAEARDALVNALRDPDLRSDALAFFRPDSNPGHPDDYSRMIEGRWDALRADSGLRAEAQRHGRILDYPLNAGAPPETGPGLSPPTPPSSATGGP